MRFSSRRLLGDMAPHATKLLGTKSSDCRPADGQNPAPVSMVFIELHSSQPLQDFQSIHDRLPKIANCLPRSHALMLAPQPISDSAQDLRLMATPLTLDLGRGCLACQALFCDTMRTPESDVTSHTDSRGTNKSASRGISSCLGAMLICRVPPGKTLLLQNDANVR